MGVQEGVSDAVVPRGGPFCGENKPFSSCVSGRLSQPWRHISKASSLSSTVISNALRNTRTQLAPSSSLDYRAGFTLSRYTHMRKPTCACGEGHK